ncbi:MAG: phage protein Gp36 family protein [Candidatus Egerieousia sp.]
MNNFITLEDYDASIHRDILDSLLRQDADYDAAIIEICEDRAISYMRSFLAKFYDCEKIFNARGEDRHPVVLMMAIDIAVYHLFCLHNPYKMSQIRKDRYDRAVEWLKAVAKGDIEIDGAPKLPSEELEKKSPWRIVSNPLRASHI